MIDEYLYELSNLTSQVAVEIGLYLEKKPLGTKYKPFPTIEKLIITLNSKKFESLTRKTDLYLIFVPEKERRSLIEKEKIKEKKDSLISRLIAINYHTPQELERLRDYCLDISKATGTQANF